MSTSSRHVDPPKVCSRLICCCIVVLITAGLVATYIHRGTAILLVMYGRSRLYITFAYIPAFTHLRRGIVNPRHVMPRGTHAWQGMGGRGERQKAKRIQPTCIVWLPRQEWMRITGKLTNGPGGGEGGEIAQWYFAKARRAGRRSCRKEAYYAVQPKQLLLHNMRLPHTDIDLS